MMWVIGNNELHVGDIVWISVKGKHRHGAYRQCRQEAGARE